MPGSKIWRNVANALNLQFKEEKAGPVSVRSRRAEIRASLSRFPAWGWLNQPVAFGM
jgi:hypothetical protein